MRSVGVGVAGLVRWPEGVFVRGPHLGFADLALRDQLSDRTGSPVIVDNDANAALVCEARVGAAGDVLLVPVREGLASRPKMMSAEPEIRLARHGRWAGAIGAAILAEESA